MGKIFGSREASQFWGQLFHSRDAKKSRSFPMLRMTVIPKRSGARNLGLGLGRAVSLWLGGEICRFFAPSCALAWLLTAPYSRFGMIHGGVLTVRKAER